MQSIPKKPRKRKIKHGMTGTAEYRAWQGMRKRCLDSSQKAYKNYGGRGITVCDRWLKSFINFYDDMGSKPTPSHSLDRIDVNGNYEPSNCRWATAVQQANNKRVNPATSNKSGYKGVFIQGSRYRAALNISLGVYDTAEEASVAYSVAVEKLSRK